MKKIAVVVIHGMGDHTKSGDPADPENLSFSAAMREAYTAYLGVDRIGQIAWREVFWQDILQEHQSALEERMGEVLRVGLFRKIILSYIGDGANFQFSTRAESAYVKIHTRIRMALNSARQDAGEDAPLVILAHSLGGHMMSTYLWDNNPRVRKPGDPQHPPPGETQADAFARGDTLAALITFGCNIPAFAYAHTPVEAIDPRRWARAGHLLPTWWHNYYAAADFLSFPLAPTGGDYSMLAAEGADGAPPQLTDNRIVVGGIASAWNIGSHRKYWTARDLIAPTSVLLRALQDGPY